MKKQDKTRGQAKSAYGKAKQSLSDLNKAWNGFRRFLGVDTTKTKF